MNRETFRDIRTKETFRQVTKPTAKKLFLAGGRIAIYPSKANPMSTWNYPPFILNHRDKEEMVVDETGMANIFEDTCNSYSYYNCNQEIGKTLKFFEVIKEDK